MPYKVYWDPEDPALIHHVYTAPVEPDQYLQAAQETARLLARVDHPVDIFTDITQANVNMVGLFRNAFYLSRIRSENERFVVVVGATGFVKAMAETAMAMLPTRLSGVHFATSHEDARQWLAAARANNGNGDAKA